MMFRRTDATEELWQWFSANRHRFEIEEPELEAYRELTLMLKSIDKGLSYEIAKGTLWELAVSADGSPELIPMVERVVSCAPKLDRWHIVAFRQPSAEPLTIAVYETELTAENVYFGIERTEKGVVDVVLYLPGIADESFRHLAHCAMLLMESLIGELDVMTRIGEIEYESADNLPEGALPLTELPRVVAELRFGDRIPTTNSLPGNAPSV
ncbi:MAG TPA: hypothetical protein VK934_09330 [Fimbriimonas sp.]|nr:hypothetical protein [Fimbriimonas sp.]